MTDRQRFEAFLLTQHENSGLPAITSNDLSLDAAGNYVNTSIQLAWLSWVQGQAMICVEQALPEEEGHYLVYRPTAHRLPAGDPNLAIREFKNGQWAGLHEVAKWRPLSS